LTPKNNQKSYCGVANPPKLSNALRLILFKLLISFHLNVFYLYTHLNFIVQEINILDNNSIRTKFDIQINTKTIALSGIGIALCFVVTAFIQIPMFGGGSGYINLGDSVVFVLAFLGGPFVGAVTGGGGGFFADLYLGYPMYSGFTLIIKGIMGFVVGALGRIWLKSIWGYIYTMMIASVWMIVGYFLVDAFMLGFEVSVVSIGGNLLQFVINILLAIMAYPTVKRLYDANIVEKELMSLLNIDDKINKG